VAELTPNWYYELGETMKDRKPDFYYRNGFHFYTYAAETVTYGSGKVAYQEGDHLCVVVYEDIKYVYPADATTDAMKRGLGLLYTYREDVAILLDGVEIVSRGMRPKIQKPKGAITR
jgi:hypothetical protein